MHPSGKTGFVHGIGMAVGAAGHVGVAVIIVLFHADETHHRTKNDDRAAALPDHLLAYQFQQI